MRRSLLGAASLFAFSLAACELVGGIAGDRELRPAGSGGVGCGGARGPGGSCGGSAAGGSLSSQAGMGGAPDTGGEGGELAGAGEAGLGGAAGEGGEGGAIPRLPPSCEGVDTCNDESPCITQLVPGGQFLMGRGDTGSDATIGDVNEQPEHSVRLSPFWLDKYEVSVGRFRRFVESYDSGGRPAPGAGAHPQVSSSGWKKEFDSYLPATRADLEMKLITSDETGKEGCDASFRTWTPAAGNAECLPMNCLDWYTSFAFCIWDGGRLPSEAEWEFAAAGGSENRLFPWGDAAPDKEHVVFGCTASGSTTCVPADLRPIGSTGPLGYGLYGQADLAGSVAERTRDIFDRNFYAENQAILPDVINLSFDTQGLNAGQDDSLARGGSYASTGAALRAAARGATTRKLHDDAIGLRCARNR